MKTTCKKSWPVNLLYNVSWFLYTSYKEVVPKIFPNLNVVGHLAVPAGWGSCLPRLAIFLLGNFFLFHAALLSEPHKKKHILLR